MQASIVYSSVIQARPAGSVLKAPAMSGVLYGAVQQPPSSPSGHRAPTLLPPSPSGGRQTPRMMAREVPVSTVVPVESVQIPKPVSVVASKADSAAMQVQRLLAGMCKTGQSITVRDILQHIELVKATVPQLLQDFPKIDHDGCGKISAKQLEDYLSPEKKGELGKKELQEIWDRLTSGRTEALPADRVFLQDLARHYQFAESVLPDLVGRFHEVDTDRSCSIERNEFDAFFGNGEAWLEARLANVIGLRELKEQIRTYYWSTRLDRMRRRGGSFVNNDDAHVLMFKGNPGVGKTTIARLITGLLHKIGVIPTENFVEVQRDQLVGDHIGATEKATEEAIAQAAGGVLFVDEAYRLNVDVFGVEAINCLMKAMSVKGNVIILAGYPKQMDEFVGVNPGIKRRVTYEFAFPDYGPEDLAKIFEHQVKKRGFEVAEGATTEVIASAIERFTTQDQRAALNGGVGEHACRHAIFHLNSRQISTVRAAAQSEEEVAPSVTLEVEDIEFGCTQVPQTDGLGPDALPSAFPTGKRPTHGVKRGLSGLTGQ